MNKTYLNGVMLDIPAVKLPYQLDIRS